MRESKNLEFKEAITNTFLKTVSAYANYGDGRILFGVSDQGDYTGLDHLIQNCINIENKINDTIDPTPDYTLDIDHKNKIIILDVKEGLDKPYFYKSKAYKRNDSATIEVDRLELTRLILEGQNSSFEAQPSNIQEYYFHTLEEKLKESIHIENITLDILKTLELYTDKNGYNNAAALLADNNQFPGIDIVRFDEDISIIFDRETFIHQSLLKQYDGAIRLYRKYYQIDVIHGALRETKSLIPESAYREAIANALVHRTWDVDGNINVSFYPDRIEVVSPGGLPNGIDEEEYYRGGISILRNKIIGNIFLRLNLIERFKTGIKRINGCYKNCDKKPEYIVTENSITIILPILSGNALSEDEQKIFDLLQHRRMSSSEILQRVEFGKTKTIKIINKLKDNGLIVSSGETRNIKYTAKSS